MMRRFWLSSTIWLLVYYTHIGPRPDSAWLDSPLSSRLLLLFIPPSPLMRSDGMNHLMIGIDSLWPAWPCQLSNCLQITMLKASSPDISYRRALFFSYLTITLALQTSPSIVLLSLSWALPVSNCVNVMKPGPRSTFKIIASSFRGDRRGPHTNSLRSLINNTVTAPAFLQ
ncbi:hypothetical protein F5880DRAFT_1035963 [Lentinula raphanica]|nr:hypothetical protein F5880DRAFT_1035963 [Lentinula raphanica]